MNATTLMNDPNSVRPDTHTVIVAFALVFGAGMATAIGASVVVFLPKLISNHSNTIMNRYVLASSLGMSAGVMIYVSMIEIFQKSRLAFIAAGYAENIAYVYATSCFFAGVCIMMILNALVTYFLHSPHQHQSPALQQNVQQTHREHRQRRRHAHSDPAAPSDAELQPLPSTKSAARTTQTTSNTDSMMDSGQLHQQQDQLAQRLEQEPPGICCASDDPVRDLEVLHQMAEILVAERELRERKQRKATTKTSDENTMTTLTETQDVNQLDNEISDQNNAAADGLEGRSGQSGSSVGSHNQDSHGCRTEDDDDDDEHEDSNAANERKLLLRMSMNTAVAIGLHNFPEGLATFVAALDDPTVGAVLAVAIAIHNIPEGLCVALPVYYATGSRRKAFGWAILSGLSEPLAAIFGYIILANAVTSTTYGILFGIIAGMMVMISTRELLPTAHRYDPTDRVVTYSFIGGMGILALSLVLFVL